MKKDREKRRADGEYLEVQEIRRICGLPELTYKEVQCRRMIDQSNYTTKQCKEIFKAEFKGRSQTTFFCNACRYIINERQTHQDFRIGYHLK